eukprot:Gb_38167 [translate_table: standard]
MIGSPRPPQYIRDKEEKEDLPKGELEDEKPDEELYVGAKNIGSNILKNILKDMEWNNKHDTRPKKIGEGRKGNQLKHDMDENIGVLPSDVHTKQNGDYISRHGKASTMPWKDGKSKIVSIGGKSQATSCYKDKLESQGHGSKAGSMINKGNRLDGIAVNASNGDISRVP